MCVCVCVCVCVCTVCVCRVCVCGGGGGGRQGVQARAPCLIDGWDHNKSHGGITVVTKLYQHNGIRGR